MFGKRSSTAPSAPAAAPQATPEQEAPKKVEKKAVMEVPIKAVPAQRLEPSEDYYDTKSSIFNALFETIDVSALAGMRPEKARDEIKQIVDEIISIRNVRLSVAEQNQLITEICDDILGYGPLEPLLARDDIADIMVNGAKHVFIETEGSMEKTNIRFRDNAQLMNICQRIVSQVGRRVDEASPICDARLLDGSRVNVIAPPLSIDGPALTIRLQIIGACQCNVVISGGTGSGKTTLLNCLTGFIHPDERIITCEDAAELQLQQPHVVYYRG